MHYAICLTDHAVEFLIVYFQILVQPRLPRHALLLLRDQQLAVILIIHTLRYLLVDMINKFIVGVHECEMGGAQCL